MQQRLLWISAAVLLIGVAVFLGVFLSRGTSTPAAVTNISTVGSPPSHTTKPAAKSNAKVPPSAEALKVAHTFLETAVVRKNLDAAYSIVGPNLKGGMSLAAWRKGNIPVAFYPAANAKVAELKVQSSHRNELVLRTVLFPRKGSGVKPLVFDLDVDRIGGKWLVNYFLAENPGPPVLPSPNR
jgi:Flp pilus assembly protein CpaB